MTERVSGFGDVRAAAQAAPSRAAWDALADALERHPDNDALERTVIPYCASIVARWPPEVARDALPSWTDRWREGQIDARTSLCTSARIMGERCAVEPGAIARVLESPQLSCARSFTIERVSLDEPGARELARTLARRAPLKQLTLRDCRLQLAGLSILLEAGTFSGLDALTLAHALLRDEGVAALAMSEDLSALEELTLSGNFVSDEGASSLAAARSLGRVARLDLQNNAINTSGAGELANAPGLGGLGELDLTLNRLGPQAARELAGGENMRQLESLKLARNWIGDGGAEAHSSGGALTSLRALDLRSNRVEGFGAIAIAHAHQLGRLQSLDVSWNQIDAEGALALITAPALDALTALDLTSNAAGYGDPRALGPARALEALDLSHNRLGPNAGRGLAALEGWRTPPAFRVAYNALGDDGVGALLGAPRGALRVLDLRGNGLTDRTASLLARLTDLGTLETLEIAQNALTLEGLTTLAESASIPTRIVEAWRASGFPAQGPPRVRPKPNRVARALAKWFGRARRS